VNDWHITGPYFEACNCDAICPCRSVNGGPGSKAPYRYCRFAVSWTVAKGSHGTIDLSGRRVVMVGYWDEEEPGTPWRVGVYVDRDASEEQRHLLAGIVTGREGGTPYRQYAAAIREVLFVRSGDIQIDHEPKGRQRIRVAGNVDVEAAAVFPTDAEVTCGVPGHDRAGYEVIADHLRVHSEELDFTYEGRCGFVASFDYRSG